MCQSSFPQQFLELLFQGIQTLKSEMHHYGQVSWGGALNMPTMY